MSTFLLLILLPSLSWKTYALNPDRLPSQYVYRQWTYKEGLPQQTVTSISQTPDKLLWFGTQEGLVAFDGENFTIFDKRTTEVLKSHMIQHISLARDGGLWIGTTIGLYKYDNFHIREIIPQINVLTVLEDDDGTVYVGSIGSLYQWKAGKYQKVENFPVTDVGELLVGQKGELWALTWDGVYKLHNGQWSKHDFPDIKGRIFHLYLDRDKRLWAATTEGFFCRKGNEPCRIPPPPFKEWVRAVLHDRDGNVWVGTRKGVWRLSERGWLPLPYLKDLINVIFEDAEGHIWIGGARTGLHQLMDGVAESFGQWEGLPENTIYNVLENLSGELILVGEYNLFRWHPRRGVLRSYPFRSVIPAENVYTMATDDKGIIYLGTNRGLVILSEGQMEIRDQRHGLKNPVVSAITFDHKRNLLWVGSVGAMYQFSNGRFKSVPLPEALKGSHVLTIFLDSADKLWVGTTGGLAQRHEGGWQIWTRKEGLGSVIALYQDHRQHLWIGSDESGLFHYDGKRMKQFTIRNGLPCDTIFSIIEDDHQNLWMSCNRGIFYISLRAFDAIKKSGGKLPVTLLSEDDGLRSHECNGGFQPAVWRDRNGFLWYPCLGGVVRIDPRKISRKPQVVKPVLMRYRLNRGTWEILPDRHLSTLTVGPGIRTLEFDIRTPYFGPHPQELRVKYRLVGYDDEWIEFDSGRPLTLQHIPPGNYRFQVSIEGPSIDAERSRFELPVTFRPYFYQTKLFYFLIGVIGILVVVGLFQIRIRWLRHRQAVLEALVEERTAQLREAMQELEEARRRFELLSYEDSLTGLANRRFFDENYTREWERMARFKRWLAVLIIDIDGFKMLNDRYGHLTGDRCLRHIARILKNEVRRPGDLIARYGGDEFVVVLPETEPGGAQNLAERIRRAVESSDPSVENGGDKVRLSVCIGVAAVIPGVSETKPSALLEMADRALYQAKQMGRNRVILAGSERKTQEPP